MTHGARMRDAQSGVSRLLGMGQDLINATFDAGQIRSALGCLTPEEFETQFAREAAAVRYPLWSRPWGSLQIEGFFDPESRSDTADWQGVEV